MTGHARSGGLRRRLAAGLFTLFAVTHVGREVHGEPSLAPPAFVPVRAEMPRERSVAPAAACPCRVAQRGRRRAARHRSLHAEQYGAGITDDGDAAGAVSREAAQVEVGIGRELLPGGYTVPLEDCAAVAREPVTAVAADGWRGTLKFRWADAGGTWALPRLVGNARAMGMAMLAEKFSAEQAESWGLIWKCLDDDKLMAEVERMVQNSRKLAPANDPVRDPFKVTKIVP